MSRLSTSVVAVCICPLMALVGCTRSQTTNKVLLVIREGPSPPREFMLTREVAVMKEMLEREGFRVDIATLTGEPFSFKMQAVQPNLKIDDVNIDNYRGVIIPCMAVGELLSVPQVAAVVSRAVRQGKPVAAQYSAVNELAKAGALQGKRYAYAVKPPLYEEGFRDGIYAGRDVVQDGNIMTSRVCPWIARGQGIGDNTEKLTQTFIAELRR